MTDAPQRVLGYEASQAGGGAARAVRRARDRSAEEIRTGLRSAVAWGYVGEKTVSETLELVDRLQAMLWRLMH